MSQRVRTRGFRRRCSTERTLVRSIPGIQTEVPPVPLLSANVRHYVPTVISDYEGLATASWSFLNAGYTPSVLDVNLAIHHFVVPNIRTTSYSAILPPVRWSPMAATSDGGAYDAWGRVGSNETLRTFSPIDESPHPKMEVSRQVVPSDSHCDFSGYTQADFSGDLTLGNVAAQGSVSVGAPNILALAPTTLNCNYVNSVYAWEFVINGTPTGQLKFGNVTALKQDRLSAATKGDLIEIDIWYRTQYTAPQSGPNQAGKGFIAVNRYMASTGAPVSQVIFWKNINRTPSFDILTHTYEVTIAGHTGWTLKNGSNGPHKIVNDGLWTRSAYSSGGIGTGFRFGSGLRWMYGSSFATLWIRTDVEIPILAFQPGSLVGPIFGYTPGSFYYYRPRNGGSTSYRKSSTKQATYNVNGSTLTPAETVTHAPSGVWAQGGTTTFDRIPWNDNLLTYVPGQGFGEDAITPSTWVPTSITLTRVNL